jgi:predicted nucleic acid-binding protein
VKVFLDTSVLIATFYGDHQHHAASMRLFAGLRKPNAFTAAHCLAETYAVATGMPGKNRASPEEAMLFLRDAAERLRLVTLSDEDYVSALEDAAVCGISGGTCYDALIARCALKAKVQALYTWNVRHFTLLGESVAARVKQPVGV